MMIIIFKQSKSNGRNNMAWVAVDKDGIEAIFLQCPKRTGYDRTKLYIPYEETFGVMMTDIFVVEFPCPKAQLRNL